MIGEDIFEFEWKQQPKNTWGRETTKQMLEELDLNLCVLKTL